MPAAASWTRAPSRGTLMANGPAESRFPGGIPAGARGPDLEFYRIGDRYLDESLRLYPTQATLAGYHKYDALLEDLTAEGIQEKLRLARGFGAELRGVAPERLSTSARI